MSRVGQHFLLHRLLTTSGKLDVLDLSTGTQGRNPWPESVDVHDPRGASKIFCWPQEENPPESKNQNKKVHLNKFLNNFRWVPDSCHREEGKCSRELYRKRAFGVISGFWVGFSASMLVSFQNSKFQKISLRELLPQYCVIVFILLEVLGVFNIPNVFQATHVHGAACI